MENPLHQLAPADAMGLERNGDHFGGLNFSCVLSLCCSSSYKPEIKDSLI